MTSKHELIRNRIIDTVSDLLYYDRKEDDELPVGSIEQAVKDGDITSGDIVEYFADEISKNF